MSAKDKDKGPYGQGARAQGSNVARYRTIVADPPWQYSKSPGKGGDYARGVAEKHYSTMTMAEILALPVAGLAADVCELYMWVTNPVLTEQRTGGAVSPVDVVRGWGFEPKTVLTWVKRGIATGFYFRGKTEHVIYATRGDVRIVPGNREANVFETLEDEGLAFSGATSGRHSEKPDAFYDLVERISPGPYLELFARRARLGDWSYWGNESLGTAAEMEGEAAWTRQGAACLTEVRPTGEH
jgi:N6-adenosine-specific RNA methylase IME4